MNVRTILIPLLCLGAVAFACGPRAHTEASLVTVNVAKSPLPDLEPREPQKAKSRRKETSTTRVAPSFTVQVESKTLRFGLDVSNVSKKSVELSFPDGQTHDFAVLDSAGREVYRWGATRMFTQSYQNRTIEAGETLRIAEQASPSLPHGSYVAVATLRSTNFPMQERIAFELK